MSLVSQVSTLATRIGTEFKTAYGRIGVLANLTTATKTDLVSAINEVKANAGNLNSPAFTGVPTAPTAAPGTSTTQIATTSFTSLAVAAIKADIEGSATGAMDTLGEVQAALTNDETAAAALTTAVGKRLRFDAAQALTGPEQTQGQSNLGVPSATAVGDTTTDFVAVFNAALV